MKPVVISIVPYKFLPAKIGGQKGIAFFNEYFSRYVELTCLTIKDNANELAKGYDAVNFFSTSAVRYINIFYFFSVGRIINQKKASHLLIEHPYFGWLAIMIKFFTGVKLVVHSHNIEALRFKTLGKWWWPVLWNYEKWTHRYADYNFFIHEADRQYALEKFKLNPDKCLVVTYGIDIKEPPAREIKLQSVELLRQKHHISTKEKIFLFTGSFNYGPNVDALKIIEQELCPTWNKQGLQFKVLVCGPWLEEGIVQHPDIIITGFVDSIEPYFQGADVFINPVMDGGGIKTKLVEALGYNCNAVSTVSGATGINPGLCNHKLFLAADGDWENFAEKTIEACGLQTNTGPEFYQHFYWGYSTKKAADFIQE